MENPSTEPFYRLIRRNRSYCNTITTCIKIDEQEYYIPEEQRHCFLKYFEDLSVPKDKGYDSEYLELCNIRHDLISKLYAEDIKSLEPSQEEDIYKAIAQLNTGKTVDEYGSV
jgi:CRISPR/Cas system-associated protein Cas10 (large subunit of type III CRISPR-Cas system)